MCSMREDHVCLAGRTVLALTEGGFHDWPSSRSHLELFSSELAVDHNHVCEGRVLNTVV